MRLRRGILFRAEMFFSHLIQSCVFYITDFKHLVPHSSAALVIISVLPGTGIWVDFFFTQKLFGS